MSNIINLVSESVFAEKMDMQNAFLAAIAANTGSPAVTSWADVQALVRAGLAGKVFSVGDRLVCKRNGSELVWDIIGIDHDTPSDKSFTHSLTLQTHKIIAARAFDSNAQNTWKNSTSREWLNDTQSGFASELDADFIAVLGKADKITAIADESSDGELIADVSSDLFFIPSRTEIRGASIFGVQEGMLYPYYTGDADRIKYKADNTLTNYYWTRTKAPASGGAAASTDRAYLVVGTTGTESATAVGVGYGIAPACCVV